MKKFLLVILLMFSLCIFACGEKETIKYDKDEIKLFVNEVVKLELQQNVNLNTNDKEIVEINNDKLEIKGLKVGNAIVTISLKENESVKKDLKVVVSENPEASYTISYDLDGGKCENLVTSFKNGDEVKLPTPEKEGYDFKGFYENETLVTKLENKNYSLKAKWEIKSYTITIDLDGGLLPEGMDNVITYKHGEKVELPIPTKEGYNFNGYTDGSKLVTEVVNANANLTATWLKSVFTIELDVNGGVLPEGASSTLTFISGEKVELPIPTKEGFSFVGWTQDDKVVSNFENKDYKLKALWQELVPTSIDIQMSYQSEIYYHGENAKLVFKVLPEGVSQEVTFKALTPTKAKIDDNGLISIVDNGQATFRVQSKVNPSLKASITINVRKYPDPFKWLDSIQIADPVAKKIRAYDSYNGYQTYALGSIMYLMFEDIDVIQNIIPEGNGNRPGTKTNGNTFKAYYVTFHDVGASGTAQSTSNYCVGKTTEVSWHYTTGNDGIYQQLPLNEIGYHAGDGTYNALEFYDSGIKAPEGDDTPAVITVNQTNGYFEVNGILSKVKAPLSGDGDIVKNTELPNDTGINNYVDKETGNYFISNTWWSSTYKTLSNRGGNLNSIGIESAVNKGSNLWYTWTKSAKLISTIILPQTRLLPRDVKQHNTFSGKNCPQTMRMANLWPEFMNMINAEYDYKHKFLDFKVELICDSPYVMKNGLLNPKNLPETDTEITYQVRITNSKDNIDKTITYKSMIPAASKITY